LYICSENGLLSIASKNPEYVEVSSIDDLFAVYNELSKGSDYDTIVIDSISEIGKMIKDKLTDNGKKQMTMQERGKYGERMMQAIRQIVNLDYNVVAIIHEQKITNDD
jgi:hypothetical protein